MTDSREISLNRTVPIDPAIAGVLAAPWGRWCQSNVKPHFVADIVPHNLSPQLIDLYLTLDIGWEHTKNYEYSKLYYATPSENVFTESQVICFRVEKQREQQKIRIALPFAVRDVKHLRLRLDALPYCAGGDYKVDKIELVDRKDPDSQATKQALLRAKKQWVREQVVNCERREKTFANHLPESLCLELTPRCNLTCGHCATHGTPKAHNYFNALEEITTAHIQRLAKDVFPYLTSLTAIGRGEPLYVTQGTWDTLVDSLRADNVLFSVVTNGLLIRRRITREIVPLIDTLTVSIDGLTQDTFGRNRGGAKISKIVENLAYFHDLRRQLALPRRPKLCLSWTMKRNNVNELPDFLEAVKDFEPDLLFTRHLMVFHERDRDQSLLNFPEISNPILEKVYKRLEELNIRHECPPIAQQQLEQFSNLTTEPARPCQMDPRRHLMKRNEGAPLSRAENLSMSEISKKAAFILRPPEVVETPHTEGVEPCMFVYRTANIHADGKVRACPRPRSPVVGDLNEGSFLSIWGGSNYERIRESLSSKNELPECRYCWYRESKYHSQRFQVDENRKQSYSILKPVKYHVRSWDFREA